MAQLSFYSQPWVQLTVSLSVGLNIYSNVFRSQLCKNDTHVEMMESVHVCVGVSGCMCVFMCDCVCVFCVCVCAHACLTLAVLVVILFLIVQRGGRQFFVFDISICDQVAYIMLLIYVILSIGVLRCL